ncbi:MAG: dicarboxylate/amino acid:cation symporter [Bacteroidia bacterium]
MFRKMPLHTRIFIGMLIGIVAGILVRQAGFDKDTVDTIISYVKPVGDIFLRFIFMMIIPLILTALILGVAELGDVSKLGRIGFKTLKFSLVLTTISVILGVGLVSIVQPGKSLDAAERQFLIEKYSDKVAAIQQNAQGAKTRTTGDMITNIVPKNPLEDMVRAFDSSYTGGGLLAVMFFALVMGIAMSYSDREKIQTFKAFLEGLQEIVMKVITFGMKLAPFGIAALMFGITVELGLTILGVLLKYVGLVLFGLAFHLFVSYSIVLKFFANTSPAFFFRNIREVMVTAFSTSSSNATLPIAIKTTIEKLKVPKEIANFILTIGSTANQNGTALYEGITILFLAQCFNVNLDIGQQIIVVGISVFAGIGTAGVPGGSLPVMMVILISLGIPGESIALIYGVDRILDMSRTVLNVTGDITAAVYINHRENLKNGQLPLPLDE